jgi:hypothetical protein
MLELEELVRLGKTRGPEVQRVALVSIPAPVSVAPGHSEVLLGLQGDLDAEWRFSRWPLVTLLSLLTQALNSPGVVKAIEARTRLKLER